MLTTVTLIEDNDRHYEIMEKLLLFQQPEGFVVNYKIERFTNLTDAIRKLNARTPDVVILDLNLPDAVGYETFARLVDSKVLIQTPIIVLTVVEDLDLGIKCLKEGAFAYYVKDWVDKNPLLLHFVLMYAKEISRQQVEIKDFVQERLGRFRPLIPRCKYCIKRIGHSRWRDESTGQWMEAETYVESYQINFTDGICPDCMKGILKT